MDTERSRSIDGRLCRIAPASQQQFLIHHPVVPAASCRAAELVAPKRTVTLSVSPACARWQLAITEIADLRPDACQQHDLYIPDGWRRIPLEPGRAPMTVDVDPHQEPPAEALYALEHSVLDGVVAWSYGVDPLRRPDRGFLVFELAELHLSLLA
jgi:hypothetical protein